MSSITIINLQQFRGVLKPGLKNGDVVDLCIRGIVRRQEDELIDVTSFDRAVGEFVLGGREVELMLITVDVANKDDDGVTTT